MRTLLDNFILFWSGARQAQTAAILIALAVFQVGCTMDTSITDISTYGLNDFERSEVLVSGRGTANGTPMSYIIRLRNKDFSLVSDYMPTVVLKSGAATLGSCTKSDPNGLSFCTISATVIGTKRIAVSNIKITLEKDIDFDPSQASAGQLVSGAIGRRAAGSGYVINSSVGSEYSETRYESPSGYKVYTSVQGDMASRYE